VSAGREHARGRIRKRIKSRSPISSNFLNPFEQPLWDYYLGMTSPLSSSIICEIIGSIIYNFSTDQEQRALWENGVLGPGKLRFDVQVML